MRGIIRLLSAGYALAIYGFIFLPVVVLIVFSLQSTAFPIPPYTGPSLRWYEAVLGDAPNMLEHLMDIHQLAFDMRLVVEYLHAIDQAANPVGFFNDQTG